MPHSRYIWFTFLVLLLVVGGCSQESGADGAQEPSAQTEDFVPYIIEDSNSILTYANGVQVYMVKEGPGRFPGQSMDIRIDYHGLLADGKVFDSSFDRGEPLKLRLGDNKIIPGLEYAIQKMRFGTKAIVVVPPEMAYKDREDVPNVPPNSTLTFHVDILGAF